MRYFGARIPPYTTLISKYINYIPKYIKYIPKYMDYNEICNTTDIYFIYNKSKQFSIKGEI